MRELAHGAIRHGEFVDFRIQVFVRLFGMVVGRDNEVFAVGRPHRLGWPKLGAAIGEISAGDLARSAAFRRNQEQLHEAGLEVAGAIEAIDEPVVGLRWVGPLRTLRRSGEIGNARPLGGHQRCKRNHFSVRRPVDGTRRLLEVCDPRGLAAIHPAHIDLRVAVFAGEIRDARAIGRPSRRSVVSVSRG